MQRGNKRRTGCRCIGDNATRDDYYLLVKIDWHQRGTKFLVERVENMKKKKARIEKTKGNEKITRNCHAFKFTPVFFSTQCYRFVNLCKVLYFINSFLFFADHNLVSKIATNRNSFFFHVGTLRIGGVNDEYLVWKRRGRMRSHRKVPIENRSKSNRDSFKTIV